MLTSTRVCAKSSGKAPSAKQSPEVYRSLCEGEASEVDSEQFSWDFIRAWGFPGLGGPNGRTELDDGEGTRVNIGSVGQDLRALWGVAEISKQAQHDAAIRVSTVA